MPLRPPSLRAITAFEAAARHQSFTKAAEELNLTQSAISYSVRSLEERLGVELFERHGRAVGLTEAGRRYIGRLRLSLSLIADAFAGEPRRQVRDLCVAVEPSFCTEFLSRRAPRFLESCPQIRLSLKASAGGRQGEAAGADVILSGGIEGWRGASRFLGPERLLPVASPGYLRLGGLARPADLTRCDLIHQSRIPWSLWFEPLGLVAPGAPPAINADDVGLAIQLAKAGVGVCLAPGAMVIEDLDAGMLVRLSDVEAVAPDGYYAAWDGSTPKRDTIEQFVGWLAAEFAETLPARPQPGRAAQVA